MPKLTQKTEVFCRFEETSLYVLIAFGPMRKLPKRLTGFFALGLGITVLVSCSEEEPVPMPAPQITRLVLDLSGSNDYLEQYRRLKPAIYSTLSENALGNPYGKNPAGPVELSITFIVESASQARVLEIVDSEFGYELYGDLTEVYGRSVLQKEKDWPLVVAAYRDALRSNYQSIESCSNSVWKILDPNFGEENSKVISQRICEYVLNGLDTVEKVIPSTIRKSGGSDIFGALREIKTWGAKVREVKPNAKIKVIFASDMVHNTDGQRDLFGQGGILTGKIGQEEICNAANEQAQLSALNFDRIEFEVIGRGNAASVSADEAEALAIFWECFAEASNFKINFLTDGNG